MTLFFREKTYNINKIISKVIIIIINPLFTNFCRHNYIFNRIPPKTLFLSNFKSYKLSDQKHKQKMNVYLITVFKIQCFLF